MINNKFIVFEGLDGAGKSTIISETIKCLQEQGKTVKYMHFPNEESFFGKIIYDKLNSKRQIANDVFQSLYIMDMVDNLEDIYNGMMNYDYLIMDRYFYSTLAYSSYYGHQNVIREISKVLVVPNEVFYIRLGVDECVKRLGKGDTHERNRKLLECVSKEYDRLSEEYEFKVLDGEKNIEENVKEVLREIR